MTKRTEIEVAILAGGSSTRFRGEKPFVQFESRPMLDIMIGIARRLSHLCTVVVSDEKQARTVEERTTGVQVAVDPRDAPRCALTGALTAFEYSRAKYLLLLPVDTPLANPDLLEVIADLCPGHHAVVPKWPSGQLEPLHASYLSEYAYATGLKVMESGKTRMQDLLESMKKVLYVSTNALTCFDPELLTFRNINTVSDLYELEKKIASGRPH
ncbi:MAG: molybdenum cofactor guanylyltransferase [Candidatus Thorarchaeota archaeon]